VTSESDAKDVEKLVLLAKIPPPPEDVIGALAIPTQLVQLA